jgi:hypothetical protein
MDKIIALIKRYKPFILALAKSRAIQGIVATAIGTVIAYAKAHLPASVIDVAGDLITTGAASLQAGGLGWAFYGRLKAAGPIELPPSPTPPTGGGATAGFDVTGGELPK